MIQALLRYIVNVLSKKKKKKNRVPIITKFNLKDLIKKIKSIEVDDVRLAFLSQFPPEIWIKSY